MNQYGGELIYAGRSRHKHALQCRTNSVLTICITHAKWACELTNWYLNMCRVATNDLVVEGEVSERRMRPVEKVRTGRWE